jgi:hypothetical protein
MKVFIVVLSLVVAQVVSAATGADKFECAAKVGRELLKKTDFRDLEVEHMYLNRRTFKTGVSNFIAWLPNPVVGRRPGSTYYFELKLHDANNHSFQLRGYLHGEEVLGAYNREARKVETKFVCSYESGFDGLAELLNDQGKIILKLRGW